MLEGGEGRRESKRKTSKGGKQGLSGSVKEALTGPSFKQPAHACMSFGAWGGGHCVAGGVQWTVGVHH